MSQQNKTTLQSSINSQLADNTSGDISAADIRDNLINVTDSLLFNSGSQGITGSLTATSFTGSLQGIATTASYVLNAVSSSFSSTASFALTSQTASYVLNATSASYAATASVLLGSVTSASYAATASYVAVNYTIYKALVTLSSGTFTVTQLQNTIGDGSNLSPNDIEWSIPVGTNGIIRATKSGAFGSLHILINVENIYNSVPYICSGTKSTGNFLSVYISPTSGPAVSTPNFSNLPVEIRIY